MISFYHVFNLYYFIGISFVVAQKCGVSLRNDTTYKSKNFGSTDQRTVNLFRLSRLDPMTRIVGGMKTNSDIWPWMGALAYKKFFICGATLIDQQFVITAAHCFQKSLNPDDYRILLGSNDLRLKNFTVVKVASVRTHPLFNVFFPRAYDIALLKISPGVTFNENINAACLPTVYVGKTFQCIVTGWGRLVQGGQHANVLQSISVPIWENSECSSFQVYQGMMHPSMLCAGLQEGGKDTCQGDSGGPLVCNVNGQWELHGVVSWGVGCAKAMRPGVYTRVSVLKGWIQMEMLKNGKN